MAGSIGTALGNTLAKKKDCKVTLLSIEPDVVESINGSRFNENTFPTLSLANSCIPNDVSVLQHSDIIFLAIPSVVTVDYVINLGESLPNNAILLNMAKGFSKDKTQPSFNINLSKQELADMSAMTKESFIRGFKELENSNIVRHDNRTIEVLNEEDLVKISRNG